MNEESNRKYCIEYCTNHGVPEAEAEKFSEVILLAYRRQMEKTLRQMCDFALGVLEDLKTQDIQQNS